MPKWIKRPAPPLYHQPDQKAFLDARRARWCKGCKEQYVCEEPTWMCPRCGKKGVRLYDHLTILAGRRFGKGLSLDTPIPTPTGWKVMRDLSIGDQVFDERGLPTVVTNVSEINYLPCFRVTFSDKTSIIADNEHQWLVWSRKFRKALRRAKNPQSTPELKLTGDLLSEEDNRDAIPLCLPLQYEEKSLPIPPYTLGAWLGDGDSAGGVITSIDQEIINKIEQDGFVVRPAKQLLRWSIGAQKSRRDPKTGRFLLNGSFHSSLRSLNLIKNKHVPSIYLQSSVSQRLDLLKGLMDTDGYCDKRGMCEFTTTNPRLHEAVIELTRSLGFRPSISEGRATLYDKDCGPKFRTSFWADLPAFYLTRKLSRQQFGFSQFFPVRYITSVTSIPTVPTKCIEVDSSSSLYLAGEGCIPTHNSRLGSISGTEEACIPNTIGWACAPTNPKLHRYVIPAFQQLIPPEWVESWSSEFNDLWLKNGSLIHFQTLEDPDQGRGQGLDWLWIDEVCELTDNHWEVISPSLGDKQGVAFFTTSPRSYDWVYEKFYQPAEENVPGFWALRARTSDNPIFQTEEGQAFLEREKSQKSDAMYRQEYEADFVIFTGAVYDTTLENQIIRNLSTLQEFIPEWPEIAPWRQILVGIDSGSDHPFGATKIVSTDRGLLVIGEYLERDRVFLQHANAIKALAGSSSQIKWAINKNDRQAAAELAQHGIYCQKAENDVVAGTERVKSWLHQRQLWFVADLVPQTLRQMRSYRWAENTSKDGQSMKERVYKRNDELPDALRYALMTWPALQPTPVAEAPKRDISTLPPEMQSAIERMRRIDNPPEKPSSVVGDFWG